jgi:ubiquinone/menaquinone biosynthesis C-methylase UbiE
MAKTFTGGRDFSARVYDVLCGWSERHGLLEWRQRLVGDLTGDVVEIGAGTGRNFSHYPAGAHVLASDYDPVMLGRAVPRAREAAADVSLFLADAMRLPVGDQSVDTLVIGLMLCSVPKPLATFEEVKRVLRPEGRVRFMEHVRGPDGSFMGRVQDFVNPAWKTISGGCHANRRTVRWMQETGFEVTEMNEFRIGHTHVSPHVMGEGRVAS